jgi:transposase
MVQGKKQLNRKPKFAEVVIGDNKTKEMRESAKTDEIKDKLAKGEAKSKSKTEQIASLVRMIFTQKRERVVFSKEEHDILVWNNKNEFNIKSN